MAYTRRRRATPEWMGYISSLKEVLAEVQFQIREDEANETDPQITALTAFETLGKFLTAASQDLGV